MIDLPFVKGWTWDVWEYHLDGKSYWGARLVNEVDDEAQRDDKFLTIQEDGPIEALAASVALYREWHARDRAIRAEHWARETA